MIGIAHKRFFLSLVITSQLFIFSGCRFGNHADQPTNNAKSAFKSVELYLTEPVQFETAVLYSDTTPQSTNSNTSMAAIPASVLNLFTDPVYFAVPSDPTLTSFFKSVASSTSIDTFIDKTGKINQELDSSVDTFWSNPKCQTQIQKFQDGSFDHKNGVGTAIKFPDGSTATSSGRLTLDYTYIRLIQGDCAPELTYLAQCYKTVGTGCTGSELSAANTLFDLYVRAGVLNPDDAAKIKALAYIVHFQ